VTTGLSNNNVGSSNADEKFTSKWGVVQAAGCMWTWGRDFSYRADGADAAAITGWSWKGTGRGSAYTQSTTALWRRFGAGTGARLALRFARVVLGRPSLGLESHIGARGRCDHLRHV